MKHTLVSEKRLEGAWTHHWEGEKRGRVSVEGGRGNKRKRRRESMGRLKPFRKRLGREKG